MQRVRAETDSSLIQRLRRQLIKPPMAMPVSLEGKHIVVTGAAPGSLGFETARQFVTWGARVLVTTRSNTDAAIAALRVALDVSQRSNIEGLALDLCDRHSVLRFAEQCRSSFDDRLDVLVNNAGIHLDLLSQWQQPRICDGFELHWRTNYLGSVHLTQLLLPALIAAGGQSGDARIVNVVSKLHTKGCNSDLLAASRRYDSWQAYGNSKLALMHFTFELQRRLAAQRVQAYCLHPGAVFTHIADKGLAGNPLIESLRNAFAPIERFFLNTPAEGAQTILYCATERNLLGGRYFQRCGVSSPTADALDADVSSRLWNAAQDWIAA